MLFVCRWSETRTKLEDLPSLLVDAESETKAIEAATEIADGVAPVRVAQIPPSIFAAEILLPEEDEEEFLLAPLEHVSDLLAAIDGDETCGDAADFGEGEAVEVVACGLVPGHEGCHSGTNARGQTVDW